MSTRCVRHGPRKTIPPGGSVSFTEDWYLLEHKFPGAGEEIDLEKQAAQIQGETVLNLAKPNKPD